MRAWVIAAIAIAVFVAVAIAIGWAWNAIGATEISPVGWLAMGFGILATSALGIGLIALMFFSSRHGWDDIERGAPGTLPRGQPGPDAGRGEQ